MPSLKGGKPSKSSRVAAKLDAQGNPIAKLDTKPPAELSADAVVLWHKLIHDFGGPEWMVNADRPIIAAAAHFWAKVNSGKATSAESGIAYKAVHELRASVLQRQNAVAPPPAKRKPQLATTDGKPANPFDQF